MRRVVLIVAFVVVSAAGVPFTTAAATTPVASLSVSGVAATSCAVSGDLNVCIPGSTTTSDFTGTTGGCTGICPSTAATIDLTFAFTHFPPSPCHANKVTGTLTIQWPADPVYPPGPIFVSVSGHLRDDHSIVLDGQWPPGPIFPPGPTLSS